jgi:hypothetical protein
MTVRRIVVCLAAVLSLAACIAPTGSSAPAEAKDIFYVTPAAASKLSPDPIPIHEATEGTTLRDGQLPFVRGATGLVPATVEDVDRAESPESVPPIKCHVCDDFGNCQPICCPGTPHCQITHV